jgi:ParB-like chromosome segregation protein Spo0J
METPATYEEMTSAAAPPHVNSQSTITIQAEKVGSYVVTLPITGVRIGQRFRSDLGDIDALAASIKALGILQPIVVDRQHNLICGHRRLLAHQSLGLETIQARVIQVQSLLQAEHDENELRKGFTASERVAIAEAIKAEIGNRQGQRTDMDAEKQTEMPDGELRKNFSEAGKRTEDIAAKKAGFGNRVTYRQAKTVVEKAEHALVQAMDKGEIAISTAATLASASAEVQRQAVAQPKQAPKLAKEAVSKAAAKTTPRINAGQAMIAVRDALVRLQSVEGMLSITDARTMVANYREAIARLVARFPELAGEDAEGIQNA